MDMFFNRRGVIVAALLLLWSLAPAAAAEANQVSIENFAFTPSVLKVKAGTTVTFVNHDDIPHSVVSKTGAFRSHALDTDEKYTYTFTKPGEFAYFCGLHPFMKGKVVVVP